MPEQIDKDAISLNAGVQPVESGIAAGSLNQSYLTISKTRKDSFEIEVNDREVYDAKEQARYGQPLKYFVYAENAVLLDGRIRGILLDEYQKVSRYKRCVKLPEWAAENPQAQTAVKFVERIMETMNFYDVFLHLCSINLYGFAFQELVFKTAVNGFEDILPFAPVVPKQINQLLHKYCYSTMEGTFKYLQDSKFDVLLSDSVRYHLAFHPMAKPHLLSRPFPFNKAGIYPALFESWIEKYKTMLDYDIFRERYAEPTLSLKYDDGGAKTSANEIQKAYDRAGRLRSLVLPSTLAAQFLESSNLSSADTIYNSPINRENETINILFRGNNLDTESDTNKASSVTGLTKEQERHKAMCDIIDEAFMGLMEKVLWFNFGNTLPCQPIIYTPFIAAKDMNQIRENIRLATDLGLAVKAEIFEELGIPVPEDQKEMLLRPSTSFAPDANLGIDEPTLDSSGIEMPNQSAEMTSLNGAQITSLVDLITQVSTKALPKEAALEIIKNGFPQIPMESIINMLDSASSTLASQTNSQAEPFEEDIEDITDETDEDLVSKEPMPDEPYLTPAQIKTGKYGFSLSTLKRFRKDGLIRGWKPGGRWRFLISDLDKAMDKFLVGNTDESKKDYQEFNDNGIQLPESIRENIRKAVKSTEYQDSIAAKWAQRIANEGTISLHWAKVMREFWDENSGYLGKDASDKEREMAQLFGGKAAKQYFAKK